MVINPDKEAERFISLREVLLLIAEAKECDPQKAARWLVRNVGTINFKYYDPVVGLSDVHWSCLCQDYDTSGVEALDLLARTGIYREIETPVGQLKDEDLPF